MTNYNILWNPIGVNQYAPKLVDLSSLEWPEGWPLPRIGEVVSNSNLEVQVCKVEWVLGGAPYVEFGVEVLWAAQKVLVDFGLRY